MVFFDGLPPTGHAEVLVREHGATQIVEPTSHAGCPLGFVYLCVYSFPTRDVTSVLLFESDFRAAKYDSGGASRTWLLLPREVLAGRVPDVFTEA